LWGDSLKETLRDRGGVELDEGCGLKDDLEPLGGVLWVCEVAGEALNPLGEMLFKDAPECGHFGDRCQQIE
jgi:hypothetical protein